MPTAGPRRVTAVSLATMVAAIAPLHLFGALSPEIQEDLGFGDAAQGFAIGGFFAVSAALSSWGGALTDRIGPSPALRGAVVASGVGATAILLSPTYALVVVGLLVAAVGNAVSQPGNNTFIAGGVPAHRRGLALGIKQSAIPMSTGLAGLALPTIAVTIGWRWAYVGAAALAVGAFLSIPNIEPPAPRRERGDNFRPSAALMLLATGSAFGAAAVSSIGAFLVRSAEDAGFTATAAGLLQVAGSVALVSTRIGWGALMDRRPIDRFMFSAGLLALGAVAYPMLATGRHGLMVVGAVLAFGAGWSWPGVVHLGTVEAHPHATGAASGIVQAGMFTGAMVGPALFGVIAEGAGFAWAWSSSAAFSATAAALIFAGDRRRAATMAPGPPAVAD